MFGAIEGPVPVTLFELSEIKAYIPSNVEYDYAIRKQVPYFGVGGLLVSIWLPLTAEMSLLCTDRKTYWILTSLSSTVGRRGLTLSTRIFITKLVSPFESPEPLECQLQVSNDDTMIRRTCDNKYL